MGQSGRRCSAPFLNRGSWSGGGVNDGLGPGLKQQFPSHHTPHHVPAKQKGAGGGHDTQGTATVGIAPPASHKQTKTQAATHTHTHNAWEIHHDCRDKV